MICKGDTRTNYPSGTVGYTTEREANGRWCDDWLGVFENTLEQTPGAGTGEGQLDSTLTVVGLRP